LTDNPDHKRANLLGPTAKGSAVQAEANRQAEAVSAKLLDVVSPEQLPSAIIQIDAIRAALDAGARKAKP
jgi:DNA-binding MarR family transcriptional regulator